MNSPIFLSALLFGPVCLAQSTSSATPNVLKTLPALPGDCSDQIDLNGLYCSSIVIKGSILVVTFAGLASKDAFPTADILRDQYLDFGRWP